MSKYSRKGYKAELFILFSIMEPSEIAQLFPEYKDCVRQYYLEYKEAKQRLKDKLKFENIAKGVLFAHG